MSTTDYQHPSADTVLKAQHIVVTSCGPDRIKTEDQFKAAGLDPEIMNACANEAMRYMNPEQHLILALDPGIGITIGIAFAATAIAQQNARVRSPE